MVKLQTSQEESNLTESPSYNKLFKQLKETDSQYSNKCLQTHQTQESFCDQQIESTKSMYNNVNAFSEEAMLDQMDELEGFLLELAGELGVHEGLN